MLKHSSYEEEKSSDRSNLTPKTLETPADYLTYYTDTNKMQKLHDYLTANQNLDIMNIKVTSNYTLLHLACLNDQPKIAQLFFTYINAQRASQASIKEWVNSRTDEGYTPIHFAAAKGNIEIIKMLEAYGADIFAKNGQGYNVMHVAAQGDQPKSLAYFREKGMPIDQRDVKGNTSLHLAAYQGMENATNFLTSWDSPINDKDYEYGNTPLHNAVHSGNLKVVRRILSKGADKTIRNNKDKTPLDLAIDNQYNNIIQLLKGPNWFLVFLNIKPSIEKRRSRFSLIMFLFMAFGLIVCNTLFILPFVKSRAIVSCYGILLFFTITALLFAWLSDPGYMKDPKGDLVKLLEKNDPHHICPECVILKPTRSKHCEYCNTCVMVYDHHCPWVNNCVGAKNHRAFLTFTILITITLMFLIFMSIEYMGTNTLVFDYMPASLYTSERAIIIGKRFTCFFDLAVGCIFLIPLIALNSVQIQNFITGKTTYERYSFQATKGKNNPKQKKVTFATRASDTSDYLELESSNRCLNCLHNCKAMCFENAENADYDIKP